MTQAITETGAGRGEAAGAIASAPSEALSTTAAALAGEGELSVSAPEIAGAEQVGMLGEYAGRPLATGLNDRTAVNAPKTIVPGPPARQR